MFSKRGQCFFHCVDSEARESIAEFIPISSVGFLYKIVAKLLAKRLRKVMHVIIDERHSTFLGGRNLLNGVLVANETVHDARYKKKKAFIFKADFEKAYDFVCFSFLYYMLHRLGFDAK